MVGNFLTSCCGGKSPLLHAAVIALLPYFSAFTPARADNSPKDIYKQYGSAIFYVDTASKADPTKFQRAGTATLIDQRGYFLTASHIFAPYMGSEELCKKGLPFQGPIILENEAGVKFKAEEVSGAPAGYTDLSLLKVPTPSADDTMNLNSIPVPDVTIGDPYVMHISDHATLIGYKDPDTQLSYATDMGDLNVPKNLNQPLGLEIKYGFNGQSGGPAFLPERKLVGVLIGPQPADCTNQVVAEENADVNGRSTGEKLSLSELWSTQALDILANIPPDDDAILLVNALNGSPVDQRLIDDFGQGRVHALSIREAAAILSQTTAPQAIRASTIQPNYAALVQVINLAINAALSDGLFTATEPFAERCPVKMGVNDYTCQLIQTRVYTYVAKAAVSATANNSSNSADLRKWAMQRFVPLSSTIKVANLSPSQAKTFSTAYTLQSELTADDPATANMSNKLLATAFQIDRNNPNVLYDKYIQNLWAGNKSAARSFGSKFLASEQRNFSGQAQTQVDFSTMNDKTLGQRIDAMKALMDAPL